MTGKRLPAGRRRELMRQAMELYQQDWTQRQIAEKFGVSQPTVFYWLRKFDEGTLQKRTAAKIREDLVCCDIYQQWTELEDPVGRLQTFDREHDRCFYGEQAARIAEGMKD